uniref:Uncharacterized protein n=1 Tax=Glossina brevipalpis TaxID=37001 RepID=A0A1A9WPY3_9MUSC
MAQGARNRVPGNSPQRQICVVTSDSSLETHHAQERQLSSAELSVFEQLTPASTAVLSRAIQEGLFAASHTTPQNVSPSPRESSPPRQCPNASQPLYSGTHTNVGRPARTGTSETRRTVCPATPEYRIPVGRPGPPVIRVQRPTEPIPEVYEDYQTPVANIDYYDNQLPLPCSPGTDEGAIYNPRGLGIRAPSTSASGRSPQNPPAVNILSRKLPAAIMPIAKCTNDGTPADYGRNKRSEQVRSPRARNAYREMPAPDYSISEYSRPSVQPNLPCPSTSGSSARRNTAVNQLGPCVFDHTRSTTRVRRESPEIAVNQPKIEVCHTSEDKGHHISPDRVKRTPVTSIQFRKVRVQPSKQELIEVFSASSEPTTSPQRGRSPAHTCGQPPMRHRQSFSSQTPQRPQQICEESGDKARSQMVERGPEVTRRLPLHAIGDVTSRIERAPQSKSAASSSPCSCPCPCPCSSPPGTTQSCPQQDRGKQPAEELSSGKSRVPSSRSPAENFPGYIVRRSPSPSRARPPCPQHQPRSQAICGGPGNVLEESSRSIGDLVTEKSRCDSPQRECGCREICPATESSRSQPGGSRAPSPARRVCSDGSPSTSQSPPDGNTPWIVVDQLIEALQDFLSSVPATTSSEQESPECEEIIEQQFADLLNANLLENEPECQPGQFLNSDDHAILRETTAALLAQLRTARVASQEPPVECPETATERKMDYLQVPGVKKSKHTKDKGTLAQEENVCPPCPPNSPSEPELDKPNIFKSIAKKISVTMDILSKLVHGRESPAVCGPKDTDKDTNPCAKVFSKKPHASCPLPKKKDDVDLPESYKACAYAKKCGRIQFDKHDHCNAVSTTTASRQLQIKELVMDNYCPGAIQETIDGAEDFNAVAFELARVPCVIDKNAYPSPPKEEPLSIIEAFLMRIDMEREGLKKGLKEDASEDEVKSALKKHFATEHNPTDLNASINSLLLAEMLTDVAVAKASKIITFEVDVQKWASAIPNKPNIKLVTYTATTTPLVLDLTSD